MSSLKRTEENVLIYREFSLKTMIEIGAVSCCDVHRDYFYLTYKYDENDIFAIVTQKLKDAYKEEQNFNLFHEQIALLLSEAATTSVCPECQRAMEE